MTAILDAIETMKPSDVIDKALSERIPDASTWGKGQFWQSQLGEADKYCMRGAMLSVLRQKQLGEASVVLDGRDVEADVAACRAIDEAINEQYPHLSGVTITRFNDALGRTYDEIRAVMEKARAALQEVGE